MGGAGAFTAGPPGFVPPRGACDCHVHVFGPAGVFPYAPGRSYTPSDATPPHCRAMLDSLGLARVVLVQPTPYGTDNSRLAAALAELGPRARGVAVPSDDAQDAELDRLHRAGVRAWRVNYGAGDRPDTLVLAARLGLLACRAAPLGWHLQLSLAPALLPEMERALARLPVDVVLEHMARLPAHGFADHPGYASLRRLLDAGRTWVKLSAPYRVEGGGEEGQGAGDLARDLARAAPERLVWGSDWPHTPRRGPGVDLDAPLAFRPLDTGAQLGLLGGWVPDRAALDRILAENPTRLYGFP